MFAVLTHSPVKFSGRRQPGSTNFDRTGFNRILSGAYIMEMDYMSVTYIRDNIKFMYYISWTFHLLLTYETILIIEISLIIIYVIAH